jgi:phage terminase small subunit
MPALKNPRWEKFCQLYVESGNASEAYRRAGYHSAITNGNGPRLIAVDSVKLRISELRAKALFATEMKREELAGYYAAVIKTPVGEVNEHHPLAQAVEITDKGTKVRLPDKNVAAAQLARLVGWDQPSKIALSGDDTLTSYLLSLRATPIGGTVLELEEGAPHKVESNT